MTAVNHCIKYLLKTKHLEVKFDVSKSEELTKQHNNAENQQNSADKRVFETSVDASFNNKKDRRSIENYTFKLFDNLID